MRRLSERCLEELAGIAQLPAYNRAAHGVGIVHIGVGAFHKAHQALYTDEAMALHGGDWMISGVSLRSGRANDELEPQDHLYTVRISDSEASKLRIIGALRETHTLMSDPDQAIAQIARPEVKVITLTITEKGYCLTADGELDWHSPEIVGDLAKPDFPVSALGYLSAGLARRAACNAGPVTIISCDNISGNGKKLEWALKQFLGQADALTLAWVEANAAFPSTMVDRIVPATTAEDMKEIAGVLAVDDRACVKTETFSQWVIEDKFAADVPDWAAAGATIVGDVEPFELAKLRLLNGAHSAIAYLGLLGGHKYVHEVMADGELAHLVTELMDEEIIPMLDAPKGLELSDYASALRNRFGNTSLQHQLAQIAMDGSQKLPQRLLPVMSERRAAGHSSPRITKAIAAWIAYMTGQGFSGDAPEVRDPMAQRFAEITENAKDTEAIIQDSLRVSEVFGDELGQDAMFATDLTAAFNEVAT